MIYNFPLPVVYYPCIQKNTGLTFRPRNEGARCRVKKSNKKRIIGA